MNIHPVPRINDVVVLNDNGIRQIFGHDSGLSKMKELKMKIKSVDENSMTFPELTYVVEVDNPEINQYMIDHRCFDIVQEENKK